MKSYPSIPDLESPKGSSKQYYIFDKLDGSNIRAEWSKKRGFYKFGTRRRLLDASDPIFGGVIELLQDTSGPKLEAIAKSQGWKRCMFFFEFYGPSSFAGKHEPEDPKNLALLDVAPYKKGLLNPKTFLALFEGVPHAPLLLKAPLDADLVQSVRDSSLQGMTFEGIVAKREGKQGIDMYKVKSQAWLDALLYPHGRSWEDV